jgi:hypothetical protein
MRCDYFFLCEGDAIFFGSLKKTKHPEDSDKENTARMMRCDFFFLLFTQKVRFVVLTNTNNTQKQSILYEWIQTEK